MVDCGAAEGLFAFSASKTAAKVFAFEPDQGFVQAMRKTFHDIPSVEIFDCAVGHKCGEAFLSNDEIFSRVKSAGDRSTKIEIKTLDSMLEGEPVSFIKADVEGFEFAYYWGPKA